MTIDAFIYHGVFNLCYSFAHFQFDGSSIEKAARRSERGRDHLPFCGYLIMGLPVTGNDSYILTLMNKLFFLSWEPD